MKFTAQSIVKIIKTCKENGVTEIEIGDFYLSFKHPTRDVEPVRPATIPDENSQSQNIAAPEDEELAREMSDVDDDEAMMLLADPEEFESRVAAGDMSEEKLHS